MPNPDERSITLHVLKWRVVISTLEMAAAIAGEIATQAAEQERGMALANGPDVEPRVVTED